jgi:hypothetical protein
MRYKHIDGVKVFAQFSKDKKYRYRLEIVSQSKPAQEETVCVVMQNPSRADEEVADKSVQFMEKVVFQKGLPEFCGVWRLIVVNQFAYIETNNFEGRTDQIGLKNNLAIESALSESDIIILGWGSGNRFEDRQDFVINLLEKLKGKKIFRTKMHPSRGRYAGFIQPILKLN